MMDVQAIRDALAAETPAGLTAYSYLPGRAELPAMVVGMPTSIVFDGSMLFGTLRVPLYVVHSQPYSADTEGANLAAALTVADTFRTLGAAGKPWKSLRVVDVASTGLATVGTTEAVETVVTLELLAAHT